MADTTQASVPASPGGERQDGGGARARNQVPRHQGSGGSSGPGQARNECCLSGDPGTRQRRAECSGAHRSCGWGPGSGFGRQRSGLCGGRTAGGARQWRLGALGDGPAAGSRGRGTGGRRVGFCPGKEDTAEEDGCAGCGAVTGLRNESLGLSLHGEGGACHSPRRRPGGVTVRGGGEAILAPRGSVEGQGRCRRPREGAPRGVPALGGF